MHNRESYLIFAVEDLFQLTHIQMTKPFGTMFQLVDSVHVLIA